MQELTAEMGLRRQYGTDIFAAIKIAQDALGGSRKLNWMRLSAFGAGAVTFVVGL